MVMSVTSVASDTVDRREPKVRLEYDEVADETSSDGCRL